MLLVSLRFRITSSPFWALPVRIWSIHFRFSSTHIPALLLRFRARLFVAFPSQLISNQCIDNSLHVRSLLRRFSSVPFVSTRCRFASIPVNSFPIRINSIRRVATTSQSMSNRFQAVSFHVNSSPFRSDSCRCGSTPTRIDSVLFPADSRQRFSFPSQIGSFRLRFRSILRSSVSQLIVSPRIKSNSHSLSSEQSRFASGRFFSAPLHFVSTHINAGLCRIKAVQRRRGSIPFCAHQIGSALIRLVSSRFVSTAVRCNAFPCRIGSDQFHRGSYRYHSIRF